MTTTLTIPDPLVMEHTRAADLALMTDEPVAITSTAFPNINLRLDGRGITQFGGGAGVVNCQYGVGPWEQFHIHPQSDGTVTIESAAFPGVFLRMDGRGVTHSGDGGGVVNCQFGAWDWEHFRFRQQSDGTVAIESVAFPGVFLRMDGRGVSAAADGGVVNCQFGAWDWEHFRMTPVGMRRVGAAELPEGPLDAAVMDPGTGYAFLGSGNYYTSSVLKVRLGNSSEPPQLVKEIKISGPEANFHSAVIANGFAYFGNRNYDVRGNYVVQIALGTGDDPPVRGVSLKLNDCENDLRSAVVDPVNSYAYFGAYHDVPGYIVKVKLGPAGPTRIGGFRISGAVLPKCATIDVANGFAYFGAYGDSDESSSNRIVKVALGAGDNPPTQQGVLILDPTDGCPVSAVLDPLRGFAYFGTNSGPGVVVKVRLSDFQRVSALTLERGENTLNCAVIDVVKDYAYFGTATGRVVKVYLGDETSPPVRMGSVDLLQPEETELACAVIDTARGFACFGIDNYPNRFVKVTLGV